MNSNFDLLKHFASIGNESEDEFHEADDTIKNTQELQEDIPTIVKEDPTNPIDGMDAVHEAGFDDGTNSKDDPDYIPEDLKAEIELIEKSADQPINSGDFQPEGDPRHEQMGGINFNDDDERVQGLADVKEYVDSLKVTEITGDGEHWDDIERDELGQAEPVADSSITGPADNEEIITGDKADAEPLGKSNIGNPIPIDIDEDEVETEVVDSSELAENAEGQPDGLEPSDVLGKESDEGDEEDVIDEEKYEDEIDETGEGVNPEDIKEDAKEPVEETEEVEVEEEVSEEVVEEGPADDEDVECSCQEEHDMVDAIQVELNDNPIGDIEETSEVSTDGGTALDEVSGMVSVNTVEGGEVGDNQGGSDNYEEAELNDETSMSDVVGEDAEEMMDGEPNGYDSEDTSDEELSEEEAPVDAEEMPADEPVEETEVVEEETVSEDIPEEEDVEASDVGEASDEVEASDLEDTEDEEDEE